MEKGYAHHENPSAMYHIPRMEFGLKRSGSPSERYVFPQRVTRDNFTSFLVTSFTRSRGMQPALWGQFEWLRVHTGFDYEETIYNFEAAGGLSSLSLAENTAVLNSFRKVKHPFAINITDLGVSLFLVENLVSTTTRSQNIPNYRQSVPAELIGNPNPEEFLAGLRAILKKGDDDISNT